MRRLKAVWPESISHGPRELIGVISRTAELLCGGIVVDSSRERNGDKEIFAKTVVQLDGDIYTSFLRGVWTHPAFEELSLQHFAKVRGELASLDRLGKIIRTIRAAAWPCIVIGLLLEVLVVVYPKQEDGLLMSRLLERALPLVVGAVPLILGMVSLAVRRILRAVIKCQGSRLLKKCQTEAEDHAERKLGGIFLR